MDKSELNRSLGILKTSLSVKDKSLLYSVQKNKQKKLLDVSRSSPSNELKRLELQKSFFNDVSLSITPKELNTFEAKKGASDSTILDVYENDKTLSRTITQSNKPWSTAAENLYEEFFSILQSQSEDRNAFDILTDLAGCCSDALNVTQVIKSKVSIHEISEEYWLEKECNIWKLLVVLMKDRLLSNREEMGDEIHFGSEKVCILNLFKRDHLLRECQLVIDWLEANAGELLKRDYHFSDNLVGWENTLHQLESPDTIVFESSRKIINRMDPDAPHHQKLPLHDIDQDDEDNLCRKIFALIRSGKLLDAEKLCSDTGHLWRAVLLEGWRLYHDPNICSSGNEIEFDEDDNMETEDNDGSKPVEGNMYRDVWKNTALNYCEKEYLHPYEKAAVGAYCGHLGALIKVCKTWEDCLWAYMRVLVDIRVESELRDSIPKEYSPLKDSYWEQRMSLNEVFEKIESSSCEEISKSATLPDYKIQKYMILDDMPTLLEHLSVWVEDPSVSTQFLRFAAHLILSLNEIGIINDRHVYNKCLEAYIEHLCKMKETELIAYYVSKLDIGKQVDAYASYLEQIIEDTDRREALKYGENSGLDTFKITKKVVYNIRNKPHDTSEIGDLQEKPTASDLMKIFALDWLLIYESQRYELLEECNALIFMFLTLRKLECAKAAFTKVPGDAIDIVLSDEDSVSSTKVNQVIREYLSYKIYLDAQEAFTAWFEYFNSKPNPPGELRENAQFTEQVAHEHHVTQFKSETERWKLSCSNLAKSVKTLFYNVLLFPEGWLTGAKDCEYMRSKVIPECVLLLFTVLYQSGQHEENVQLADIIASEKYGLYKVYSKEKLGEFLMKLGESSIALLNSSKDPWGQDATV